MSVMTEKGFATRPRLDPVLGHPEQLLNHDRRMLSRNRSNQPPKSYRYLNMEMEVPGLYYSVSSLCTVYGDMMDLNYFLNDLLGTLPSS